MSNVDASSEFDSVQGTFDTKSNPILSILETIAVKAHAIALGSPGGEIDPADPFADPVGTGIPWKDDSAVAGETGFTNVADVSAPADVDPNDIDIFQLAIDYLDELKAQALQGATFPSYGEIVGTPPDSPETPVLDMTEPTMIEFTAIPQPEYDPPIWNDGSAWSGGDVANDTTVGPLVLPFEWIEQSYTSNLMSGGINVLYEAMIADFEDTSYGLDALDEGRLFDRMRERESRSMAAALEENTRVFSMGGFSVPTGATAAAILRALTDGRDKVSSGNREIMSKKTELFLEAKKVAMANGIEIEKLGQAFFNSQCDFLLRRITQEITSTVEVATYNINRIKMHVDKYSAFAQVFGELVKAQLGNVEVFKGYIEAEGVKAQTNKAMIEQFATKAKLLTDTYIAQIEGFKSVADARIRYHNVLADVYKTYVGQLNARTDATKEAFSLVDKQHKNTVDFALGKFNGQIAGTKVKLDEIMGALNAKIEQLKVEAQSAVSLAASAMSALNVNLGLSLGASASIGGTENFSSDVTAHIPRETRSHSWDETKGVTTHSDDESRSYSESHTWSYDGNI